ncbi:hypothetical protein D3C86_2176380 [compost metagenome]
MGLQKNGDPSKAFYTEVKKAEFMLVAEGKVAVMGHPMGMFVGFGKPFFSDQFLVF